MTEELNYKKKDFVSDQEVRWCPGCGDYAVLSAVQNAMTKIGKKKEDIVFISGIGCSSRFPYYMDTFGMHTIHGRALPIASGLKIHNPKLSVWVATGDGDAMAIGGNHLIHALRRNIDINIIMFNNEIYGLTKGQYSPTTKQGMITKTTPHGVPDHPFVPASLALGCEATFFARTIDTDIKHITEMVLAASHHTGTSFIEIYQNCVIFNDKVHDSFTNRLTRDDNTIKVEHDKPMVFGKERNKGIMLEGTKPKVVTIGENGVSESDLLVYDEHDDNMAYMLTRMNYPEFPVAIGKLRHVQKTTYTDDLDGLISDVTKKKGVGDMQKMIESGLTWDV